MNTNLSYLFVSFYIICTKISPYLSDVYSSAYQFYSREQSSIIRDNLLSEGKDAGMGTVVQIVSANVRGTQ